MIYEGWQAKEAIKDLRPGDSTRVKTPSRKILYYVCHGILGPGNYTCTEVEEDLFLVTRLK